MNADETFVSLLRCLLDPSEEWTESFGDHTLDNVDRGLSVWTSNVPVLDTNLYRPGPLRLSLWQKYQLWRGVAAARTNAAARCLAAEADNA